MSVSSISSTFIRLPLIALGLSFATWSAMTGIAAIDYFRVQGYVEAWSYQVQRNPAYQIPTTEYENALSDAQQAVKLIPYNSDYHVGLADILTWKIVNTANLPTADRQNLTTEVLNHYHIAIKQRPSWPYTYTKLALTKAKLGEIDQEMMTSLQKANQLGPREIDILHMIIQLGLANWKHLDHDTQLTVASALDKTLSWNIDDKTNAQESLYALSFLGAYHLHPEVCPLLTNKNKLTTMLCSTATAKPNLAKAHK